MVKVLLVTLEIITSVLLIVIILLQRTKSQGAGGLAFGAGMGETIFGPQVGNVLTKATVVLGIIFLVNTIALTVTYSQREARSVVDRVAPPSPGQAPALPRSPMAPPPESEPVVPVEAPAIATAPETVPASAAPETVPAQPAAPEKAPAEPAAAPAPAK
jgi:preprotein translocase subunit SecG